MTKNKTWETTIIITQNQIEQMYELIKEAKNLSGPNSPYSNGHLNNVRFKFDMESNKFHIFPSDCTSVEYTIEADCIDGSSTPSRHSVKRFNYKSDNVMRMPRSRDTLQSITEEFKH